MRPVPLPPPRPPAAPVRPLPWRPRTGVSMRTTEVDGESYMIGQFFAHDRAQIDDGMTFYIAKLSHAYHESPMLPIAIEILNPDGICNKDREIQSVVAA